jgi:hypothetical protein
MLTLGHSSYSSSLSLTFSLSHHHRRDSDSDGLAGAGSASRVHLSLSASFRTSSPHRASFAFSTAKTTVTGGLPKAAVKLALFCSIFL